MFSTTAVKLDGKPEEIVKAVRQHAAPNSPDGYAIIPTRAWNAIRAGKPVPDHIPDATKKPAPRAITLTQLAAAERRAAVCENCDANQGVTLRPGSFPVLTVKCADCSTCAGLSLVHGECPRDLWPPEIPMIDLDQPPRPRMTEAEAFAIAREKRRQREQRRAEEAGRPSRRVVKVDATRGRKAGGAAPTKLVLHDATGQPVHLRDLYRGYPAFLICSGPSLADMDLEPLKQPGILTMGVNNSPAILRPNLWTSIDSAQNFIRSIWLDPTITKFATWGNRNRQIFDSDAWQWMGRRVRDCPNVLFYHRNSDFNLKTFLTEPSVNTGGPKGKLNVMFAAMRLLHHVGVRRLYLLGCDWRMEPNDSYAFAQVKSESQAAMNNRKYDALADRFARMHEHFEARGFQVRNCNAASRLKAFPHVPLDQAIDDAVEHWGRIDVNTERTGGLYTDEKPPK